MKDRNLKKELVAALEDRNQRAAICRATNSAYQAAEMQYTRATEKVAAIILKIHHAKQIPTLQR